MLSSPEKTTPGPSITFCGTGKGDPRDASIWLVFAGQMLLSVAGSPGEGWRGAGEDEEGVRVRAQQTPHPPRPSRHEHFSALIGPIPLTKIPHTVGQALWQIRAGLNLNSSLPTPKILSLT